jgi:hypothetical protein
MADDASVRTPTKSEINTFRVLANMDFADLRKSNPTKNDWEVPWQVASRPETPRAETPLATPRLPTPKMHTPKINTPVLISKTPVLTPRSERSQKSIVYDPPPPKPPAEVEADIVLEKEALLYEIELLEKQGLIKLHRSLTMDDTLESIQYQYDRANMIVSSQQTVEWAKSGIKMGSTLLELGMKKFGVNIVDGFSSNLCKDMSKFNKPLTKLYRKYWRRGTSSPESELAMIVFGALAMTVLANKGLGSLTGTASAPPPPPVYAPPPKPEAPKAAPVVPEWAKMAMAAPLIQPKIAPAAHFAKETFPEVAVERLPVIPVPVREEAPEPVVNKKVMVMQSPKSSRRKKEPQSELNLDDVQ